MQFTADDIEILDKEIIYHGHMRLLKYRLRYRLFAGGWSPPVIRELFDARHAVGVLLFDPVLDKIVLIEEFRMGMLHQKEKSPWMLELVAGLIEEKDNHVNEVAKREALEEAGCEVLDLIPIHDYWTAPGISTGKFTLFCGRIDASNAGGIFGLADEHEDIRVHVLNTGEVFELVKTGRICNAASIIAVQWLQLNLTQVKHRWLVR